MNQKTKTSLENTWLCLNCRETIIPFSKGSSAFAAGAVVFFIGIAVGLWFNIAIGLILVAFAIAITGFGKSDSKFCPSCESSNIVPGNSPAAKLKRA